MKFRKGLFVLVGCVFSSICAAQQVTPGLQVTGVASNRDGDFFAVLKGIGVVKKGDVVLSTVDNVTYKYLVMTVESNGMEVKKLDSVAKNVEVTSRPKYEFRDPFCPIPSDELEL